MGNLVTHFGSGFEEETDSSLDIFYQLVDKHLDKMAPFAIFVKVTLVPSMKKAKLFIIFIVDNTFIGCIMLEILCRFSQILIHQSYSLYIQYYFAVGCFGLLG